MRSGARSPSSWWPTTSRPASWPTTWCPSPPAASRHPVRRLCRPMTGLPRSTRGPGPCAAEQLPPRSSTGPGTAGRRQRAEPAAGDPRPGGTARLLAGLLAPVAGRFTGAAVVGTFAAIFAVALSGLSGWLIIRASEQPPILYLLTAIVGVRFFGIGRAVLRYWERLLLHDAVFGALTRLRGRLWESLSRKASSLRRLLQGGNVLGTVIDDVDTVRDLLPRVVLPPVTALAVAGSALLATTLVAPAALPAVAFAAALACSWRRPPPCGATAARPPRSSACGPASCGARRRPWMPGPNCTRTASRPRVLDALRVRGPHGHPGIPAFRLGGRPRPGHHRRCLRNAPPWPPPCWPHPRCLQAALEPATAAVVVLLQLALVEPYAAMTTAVRQYPALRTVMRRVAESGVLDGGATDAGGRRRAARCPRPPRRPPRALNWRSLGGGLARRRNPCSPGSRQLPDRAAGWRSPDRPAPGSPPCSPSCWDSCRPPPAGPR